MTYATEEIFQTLRAAREQTGLSQRGLSARTGVPQSHISKIESGATDLRLSSLVELARSLELELMLVPRKLAPAVDVIVRSASTTLREDARRRTKTLRRAQGAISKLLEAFPEHPGLDRLEQTVRELGMLQLGPDELAIIRDATALLTKAGSLSDLATVGPLADKLRNLRNRIAHAVPHSPRAAYTLDEDDDA